MSSQGIRRQSFFVGGQYVGASSSRFMQGQMYVETLTPTHLQHTCPLVFIHGSGQTAMNWLSTPDGRPGWAEYFAGQGWQVVLVDQPARGRSAWQPQLDGEMKTFPVPIIEALFTACSEGNRWPQAKLHTQWPGGEHKGHPGDPAFDQFYASQVPFVAKGESELRMRSAGAALLDRIGPAILIGHSQGGSLTWLIGDERPDAVRAIVAIEPSGPPYKDALLQTGAADRLWGLTSSPLTYSPPVTEDDPLTFELQPASPDPGLVAGWLQKEPARPLVHLSRIPMLVITAESSYHTPFDHCSVDYLRQAGVNVDFIRLEERGVHGNGHMMMLENNSLDIAQLLEQWIQKQCEPVADKV